MRLRRQKALLEFVRLSGGQQDRLSLVKLAFVLSKLGDLDSKACYQFLPYKFGPYSFTLGRDLQKLIDCGLLRQDSDVQLSISDDGAKTALELDYRERATIQRIWKRWGRYSKNKLIDAVYDEFPWFALNSIRRNRPIVAKPETNIAIYTAGYEGMQVDGFLNFLLESGIKRIIDVRANPISRVFGFYGSTLSKLSGHIGISYSHFSDLGISTKLRKDLHDIDDRRTLLHNYKLDISDRQPASLSTVVELIGNEPSVLVCQEHDPETCHRSRLADVLASQSKYFIEHLRYGWNRQNYSDASVDYCSHLPSSV